MNGRTLRLVGLLLALVLVIGLGCQFAANLFWFTEVGYAEVFWLRLLTQVGIGTIASGISAVFLLGNLALAARLKYPKALEATLDVTSAMVKETSRSSWMLEAKRRSAWRSTPESKPIPLKWLLPSVLGLSVLASLLLRQHIQAIATAWQSTTNQLNGLPPLPDRVRLEDIWQSGRAIVSLGTASPLVYLAVGLGAVVVVAVLLYPAALLSAIALGESLGLGFILSAHWGRFLQLFHAVPFGQTDPLFANDISGYVFALPIAELLTFWLFDLFLFGLLAVALVYLLGGNSLSQGCFIGFSRPQRQHLAGLGGCFMLAMCLHHWLSRYELLYSTRGATYGAGYTDITVLLPAYTGLSLLAGAIAIVLCWQAFRRQKAKGKIQNLSASLLSTPPSLLLSSPTELFSH